MVRVVSLRLVLLAAAAVALACLVAEAEARSDSLQSTLERARRSLERSTRQADSSLDIPKRISAAIFAIIKLILFQLLSPAQFKMLYGEEPSDNAESLLD